MNVRLHGVNDTSHGVNDIFPNKNSPMAPNFTWKNIFKHILILVFFLLYEGNALLLMNPNPSIVKFIIVYGWYISFFYLLKYIALPFWESRKRNILWIIFLPAVLVAYAISIIFIGQLCNKVIGLPYVPVTGFIFRMSLFRSGYIMGLALLFFYQSLAIQKEKMIRIREQEYDRSRINQHLVFNTLSFMYEALEIHSPQVARTALDLSDILSYSLQQSGSTGKVPVIDEVEQMHRYIRVNQQLYDNQLQLDFSAELSGNVRDPDPLAAPGEPAGKYVQTRGPYGALLSRPGAPAGNRGTDILPH